MDIQNELKLRTEVSQSALVAQYSMLITFIRNQWAVFLWKENIYFLKLS